jgi:hypothetical protein
MTCDIGKLTSGLRPSAARFEVIVERALELSRALPDMTASEQEVVLVELKQLMEQLSSDAYRTAEQMLASAPRN